MTGNSFPGRRAGDVFRRLLLAALIPAFMLPCASCRFALNRLHPGNFSNPFANPDHVRFTHAATAAYLEKHRITPSSVAMGKMVVTLEDCRAAALANNLDLQTARLEQIIKKSVELSNRSKILPHLVYSGELSERDNTLYSYSDPMGMEGQPPEPGGGTGVNNWAVAHERGTWRYSMEARWSPTDAALAFYTARSGINDTIKAHHQKVRVAQKLIGLTDAAYFRLLALQQCLPIAQSLASASGDVADRMEKLLGTRLKTIEDAEKARQRRIKARGLLDGIRNDLAKEKNDLASAMGLAPDIGCPGGVVVVGALPDPVLDIDICKLELEAVVNRPEAYQAGLNHFNSINDLRRAIVRYFPKITAFWRTTHDKDKYIWNKDWKDIGAYIYVDLLDLLVNKDEKNAADANAHKTHKELGAVALGITSQVRVAALKFEAARDKLIVARELLASSERIFRSAEQKFVKDSATEMSVEEARLGVLQDKIDLLKALGEANATLAELMAAVGTNYNEPLPSSCGGATH